MFTGAPGFDPSVVEIPHVMEGRSGEPARNVEVYRFEMRRRIDSELVARSNDFMRRQVKTRSRFFCTSPSRSFTIRRFRTGTSSAERLGDFADSMVEMDHRVGQILDEIDSLQLSREHRWSSS